MIVAGLEDVWDLELYGKLLETGGGKERMTAYFSVCLSPSHGTVLASSLMSHRAFGLNLLWGKLNPVGCRI